MGTKILTVDDDQTIRKCVTASLKAFTCEVFQAADGLEGLTVAQHERPDLILLDFIMPVMDGSEMLAKLKADPNLRTIPVLMLTAEATRDRVMGLAKQGVNDYLLKPFRKDQIIERVGRIVDLKIGNQSNPKTRRFDDPLQILVVDDKPAIIEQIQEALAGTGWTVRHVAQPGQAVDHCTQSLPDIILISLSLPDSAGFMLFQMLRTSLLTRGIPIVGLSVKTATSEQSRAQQLGFSGITTKPISARDLQAKIVSALHLDTSFRYFKSQEAALILTLPAEYNSSVLGDVSAHLRDKLTEAVDAGLNRCILDLSKIQSADVTLVKLGLNVMQVCRESQIPCGFIGSESLCGQCKEYEEAKNWQFARSHGDALELLNEKALSLA
jgi:two-component system, cell cycle response regulator